MAENIKSYKIVINGIEESISQVDRLINSLKSLEERINAVDSKSVNVSASTPKASTGGGSKPSALSEEEKLLNQINQLEEKRIAASKNVYQGYLANKDLLKETIEDQKALAAQERLQASAYSNTIKGMKDELADIKVSMQTVDLGDGEQLKKMAERANELNTKLKQIEESYGQFGRNVGNYASAADGFKQLTITVGGVERSFNDARDASRQLSNELKTMALNGQQGTKEYEELQKAVLSLNSAIKDATVSSQGMDEMLDTLQSFASIGSATQGFSALFGFDNTEIERSIQKLVALQNVMKGIEEIQQQIRTQEGIGLYLARISDATSNATNRMLVYNRALSMYNKGMLGSIASTKAATVAINVFGTALKALTSIGLIAFIAALAYGIQKLIEATSKWVKGNADLVSSEKILKSSLDATNDALDRNLKLIEAKYNASKIGLTQKLAEEEKAYAKAISEANDELQKRLKLNSANSTFASYASGEKRVSDIYNDDGVTTLGGFSEQINDAEELTKRYNALSDAVEKNTGLVYKNAKGIEIAHLSASDARDELNHLDQMLGGVLVNSMNSFDLSTKKGREGLRSFVKTIQDSDNRMYKSVLLRLPEIVDNEKGNLGTALNGWLSEIQRFVNATNSELNALNFDKAIAGILEAADKTGKLRYEREKKQLQEQYDQLTEEEKTLRKSAFDAAMKALEKEYQERRKTASDHNKKLIKEAGEAEKDLAALRISNMKEGLNKVIKQLEEERKQRLAKVRLDNRLVNEQSLEINRYYDNKIEEEKKKHAKQIESTYTQMWDNILTKQIETQELILRNSRLEHETMRELNDDAIANDAQRSVVSSYGIQGKRLYSPSTQRSMGIVSTSTDKMTEDAKKVLDLRAELLNAEELLNSFDKAWDRVALSQKQGLKTFYDELESLKKNKDKLSEEEYADRESSIKNSIQIIERRNSAFNSQMEVNRKEYVAKYDKFKEEIIEKISEINKAYSDSGQKHEFEARLNALIEENYSKSMVSTFEQRQIILQGYWAKRLKDAREYAEKESDMEIKLLNDKHKKTLKEEEDAYTEQFKVQNEWYQRRREQVLGEYELDVKNGKLRGEEKVERERLLNKELEAVEKEYNRVAENYYKAYTEKIKQLEEQHGNEILEIVRNKNNRLKQENAEYYQTQLQELRDFQTAINNLESKQPIMNAWNITNLKETNKNNRELLNSYESLIKEVRNKKKQLNEDYGNGLIERNVYESTLRELDTFTADIGEKMDKVKHELSFAGQAETIIQDAQQYINVLGNHLTSLLSTIWGAQDAAFDYEMELMQKQIDEYQDKLDKQEEMTRTYADNVSSIEDELKTARGDRRQQLIDDLNAQMSAQRASLAEEKRIEKEKKKLEAKKEKEEEAQRKKQHDRDVVSAIISTALATVNALATKPFVPVGLAMAALAATMGAVQVGIIKSQKYAQGGQLDGGVIQGKSHAQGGVKVLGGRIELEGKEFITNHVTTQKNVELLEFINSKHRKLNISDFVDFYASKKTRSNIASASPKKRFASGGQIPTLRNDIEIDNRLIKSFEDYSNRPVVVEVKEILSKAENVRSVQALAGITPNNAF